jgi:hypothetical protein
MYSKIERGERRAKREQIIILANLFQTDQKELLTLWLADQIYVLVKEEVTAIESMELVSKELMKNLK